MCEIAGRVIVLDDDPTGSQAARDVSVLTRPNSAAARDWLKSDESSLYVVTNTRSMAESAAVEVIGRFVTAVRAMNQGRDKLRFVLRGDSTLRGHVLAEIDCVGGSTAVTVFVPAFPEGGRITLASTHYIRDGSRLIPVAETEFARDPVFGFRESSLPAWFAARAPGRPQTVIDLATVRRGAADIAPIIAASAPGAIVIPDAETVEDVRAIVAAVVSVEAAGVPVLLRGSATAAALRAGVYAADYVQPTPATGPVLLVCGSHTSASTRQLATVCEAYGAEAVVLDPYPSEPCAVEVERASSRLRGILRADGLAVLSTGRTRPAALSRLADGASMMARLTAVAHEVADEVGTCIVKGGITSAEIAATAFGADQATVCGQLEAGVSLWRLTAPRSIDYVVVPGNIGDDGTLLRCVAAIVPGHVRRSVPK